MDGYQALANAIVMSAVKDYKTALKRKKKNPNNRSAQAQISSLERFFRSSYCQILSDLNSEYLIRRMRKEVFGNDSKGIS